MRINQFVAQSTGLSRRAADQAIASGRITIEGRQAKLGDQVSGSEAVCLDGKLLSQQQTQTILLHKPVGYVCSREGQGSKTIYDLLPLELHTLKPVGRLDKNSSGLLLLTNDGRLANQLTHPSFEKTKIYEVSLNKTLKHQDQARIEQGINLNDGPSSLSLATLGPTALRWQVSIHEGRNRQIRRTFAALGYVVETLHRTRFGDYMLGVLPAGEFQSITEKVA